MAKQNLLGWAKKVPNFFMEDASYYNQGMMQFLSKPIRPVEIDGEIGSLEGELLTQAPQFTYLRYNIDLDAESLKEVGLQYLPSQLASLKEMDAGENQGELNKIGSAAAAQQVEEEHFRVAFDVWKATD